MESRSVATVALVLVFMAVPIVKMRRSFIRKIHSQIRHNLKIKSACGIITTLNTVDLMGRHSMKCCIV